jgi:hypothetical protein
LSVDPHASRLHFATVRKFVSKIIEVTSSDG